MKFIRVSDRLYHAGGGRVFWVNHKGSGKIEIEGTGDMKKKQVLNLVRSPVFDNWAGSLSRHIKVEHITVASIDYKSDGKPLFAKLTVKAFNEEGRRLPGVVFLRGGSVAILPILISKETGKMYVIFTVQARVAVGRSNLVEIPAGMLDGSGNFSGIAAKEFEEEIGFKIKTTDLIDLTPENPESNPAKMSFPRGMFVSPGAMDETIRYYLFVKTMRTKQIVRLRKKLTGNAKENESIRLMVTSLEKAPRVTSDSKFFCAIALAMLQGSVKYPIRP